MIKLHFYKWTSLISRLIQLRTFSKFSHVSIEVDGTVYESHIKMGVVESPYPYTYNTAEFETVEIKWNEAIMKEFLKRQVGKKYDLFAIFVLLGNESDRNDNGKWFCSELASIALYKWWVMKKPNKLISPWLLYDILTK